MPLIPATSRKSNVPLIGFIAHVDISPEASGASVKPIIHRSRQGQDIVLPDDPTAVLRLSGTDADMVTQWAPGGSPRCRRRFHAGHVVGGDGDGAPYTGSLRV